VNPRGSELWKSNGEVNVAVPPPGVLEMDMPLVAAIDLPIDQPGIFTMRVSLDDAVAAEVPLQVTTPAAPAVPGGTLLS
jgi:hypothetical protein